MSFATVSQEQCQFTFLLESPATLVQEPMEMETIVEPEMTTPLATEIATPKRKSSTRKRRAGTVPRPLNAWMIYRKLKHGLLWETYREQGNSNLNMSTVISQMWKNETAEVKAIYYNLAAEEKAKHAEKYPGYKYQPRRKSSKNKKSASCTDTPVLSPAPTPVLAPVSSFDAVTADDTEEFLTLLEDLPALVQEPIALPMTPPPMRSDSTLSLDCLSPSLSIGSAAELDSFLASPVRFDAPFDFPTLPDMKVFEPINLEALNMDLGMDRYPTPPPFNFLHL